MAIMTWHHPVSIESKKVIDMPYLTQKQLQNLNFKSLGKNVRISDKASIYSPETISIGDYSRIDDFCVIKGPLTIGKYVHIAPFCLVSACVKEIFMDDFSGLAFRVSVFSSTDDYTGASMTNPVIPDEYKKVMHGEVNILRHVIIGTNSVVMPGVTLEEGCSVGALTFVTKSTEPWGVYFGSPAKRISDRKKDLLKYEEAFLESLKPIEPMWL